MDLDILVSVKYRSLFQFQINELDKKLRLKFVHFSMDQFWCLTIVCLGQWAKNLANSVMTYYCHWASQCRAFFMSKDWNQWNNWHTWTEVVSVVVVVVFLIPEIPGLDWNIWSKLDHLSYHQRWCTVSPRVQNEHRVWPCNRITLCSHYSP